MLPRLNPMEIADVNFSLWELVFNGIYFPCAEVNHEEEWIPALVPLLDDLKASAIDAASSSLHINSATTLYPTLVCTHRKNRGRVHFVVLYVASSRTNSLPYRFRRLCWKGS